MAQKDPLSDNGDGFFRAMIHKNDTTLCKSHGQEPEGQHEYSKEQDGVIEINLPG